MERSIAADLERSYHVAVRSSSPVSGGWLNLKWKISTDAGCLLVKQFSTKRFSRQKLELVEDALQRQIKLKETGVPCPSIRTCGGRAIRLLDGDTAYMVMEFCPGAPEGAATVNERQLYNLGGAYGRMRKSFSALPTAASFLTGYGKTTVRFRDELLWLTAHWFEIDSLLMERVG